jgi:hypothetical protein
MDSAFELFQHWCDVTVTCTDDDMRTYHLMLRLVLVRLWGLLLPYAGEHILCAACHMGEQMTAFGSFQPPLPEVVHCQLTQYLLQISDHTLTDSLLRMYRTPPIRPVQLCQLYTLYGWPFLAYHSRTVQQYLRRVITPSSLAWLPEFTQQYGELFAHHQCCYRTIVAMVRQILQLRLLSRSIHCRLRLVPVRIFQAPQVRWQDSHRDLELLFRWRIRQTTWARDIIMTR